MTASTMLAVGQVVRYPEPPVPGPEYLDGCRNFFNLTAMPGAPRLIMNRGIDHPAWVVTPDGKRRPLILLRSNPLQAGSTKTPWHDVIDLEAGQVLYYGDHRASTTVPLGRTRGNEALLLTAEAHRSASSDGRAAATPLLIFRSVERNRQSKGYLEFCGLGTIDQISAIEQEDPETGKSFPNYAFDISLLDLSPEGDRLDWRWINARRTPALTTEEANLLAPSSWKAWVDKGDGALVVEEGAQNHGHRLGSGNALRSPDWTWDELVLACALVYQNDWKEIKRHDRRALELSDLLQILPVHPLAARADDFRSPSSVQHKTADIATVHPSYAGKTTKGGRLTKEAVDAFLARPQEMLEAAQRIREVLATGDPNLLEAISTPPLDEPESGADEGRVLERLHRYRERNSKLRKRKIEATIKAGKALACDVCGFDFAKEFGVHGNGYIEVHHVIPLHEIGPSRTQLKDLALLCANCHRMSHRRLDKTSTWPSPQELRKIIGR
ncbi:HNH endonuclease [Spirillospora sp. NPDC048823]|uniref:HNH endonuclease n=1 Tax=unclassified Spirillospora TaxID=2642701 RepID=UPI00371A0E0B